MITLTRQIPTRVSCRGFDLFGKSLGFSSTMSTRLSKRIVATEAKSSSVGNGVSPKKLKKQGDAAASNKLVHDGKCRCGWIELYAGSHTDAYVAYHDTEWGVPRVDDSELFEHLTLDGAQAGLSWSTILGKREAYTRCYKHWDIAACAAMTPDDVEELLKPESGIVKHRGKIASAINNAKCILEAQREFGSLAVYMWSFMPASRPLVNSWSQHKEAPTVSEQATMMSKSLKKRGFKFVGPVMCYAMMQAVGMVNDHSTTCFRHKEVQALADKLAWPFPRT